MLWWLLAVVVGCWLSWWAAGLLWWLLVVVVGCWLAVVAAGCRGGLLACCGSDPAAVVVPAGSGAVGCYDPAAGLAVAAFWLPTCPVGRAALNVRLMSKRGRAFNADVMSERGRVNVF